MYLNIQHSLGDETIYPFQAEEQVATFDGEDEEVVLLAGTSSDVELPTNSPKVGCEAISDEETKVGAPQNATSLVWKFFLLKRTDGLQKCLCTLCSKEVSYSGTSNLWKHLASKHAQQYNHLQQKEHTNVKQSIKSFFATSDNSKQNILTNLIVSELICNKLGEGAIQTGFIFYLFTQFQ